MDTHAKNEDTRLILSALGLAISACALSSAFISSLYSSPAQVVVCATILLAWSALVFFNSHLSEFMVARAVTLLLSGIAISSMIMTATEQKQDIVTVFAFASCSLIIGVSALNEKKKNAYISLIFTMGFLLSALIVSKTIIEEPIIPLLGMLMMCTEFFLIRSIHLPVAASLHEARARADIFSTITRSSREFDSKNPEKAIRNIANVTKALGYTSMSLVSFDRRQKIFEEGAPIPGVMDIAVKASAMRRVTITKDDHASKNSRDHRGDIVGVPIWINGRYSAALIVQTSPTVKVAQRDCEALELLADQAGRALENAGKAAMDRRIVERLTDESQRDTLTGLGNRRFADSMVASMKPGDVLAMVDLDGLKGTNDLYGHSSGDELLHEVGVFLTEQIRNPDLVARLGGDEFIILLRDASEGAQAILERLLVLWKDKKLYNTTFSIGMAIHNMSRSTMETVEAADDALYQAKSRGKNRLICAVPS